MKPSSFLTATKIEFIKYKSTRLLWLTLLSAFIIPATKTISCLISDSLFALMQRGGQWQFFLMINWRDIAAAALPIFVILLNNSVAQVESSNNNWKQLYTLPWSYADIFLSKFMVVQVMILLFFLFSHLFYLAGGVIVYKLRAVPGFYHMPIPWKDIGLISIRVYAGILALSAIQYWLSIRFRNSLLSIGVGMGLLIGFLLIGGWGTTIYAPYLFPLLMFYVDHSPRHYSLPLLYTVSIAGFALCLLIAYRDISVMKIKG